MKKIFIVLIMFLVLIIPNIKVDALEDSFYEGEYISGEYFKKFKGGSSSGKYQQMRVFRRNSDDSVVYCIELWESLRSNTPLTGYNKNQDSYANIDDNTWKKIMLLSYYGYGYENHTDIKWYAITQFMIWKITSPDSNIYFTDTLNGNKITKYQDEMDEINELVNNHDKLPSFNNDSYKVSYNTNFTITDQNNVLKKFNIIGYNDIKITKNGNNLTIIKKTANTTKLSFINSAKLYDRKPTVYIDNDGQDVLLPGDYDNITAAVYFNLLSSTVTINKRNLDTNSNIGVGDAKLDGTKIQLLDSNKKLIDEKTVDSNGIITFDNVIYGDYYLKEVTAGEGYLLNNDLLSIKVDEEVEEFDFYNEVIKNKIIFNKYLSSSLTDEIMIEEGAMFTIYNSSNEEVMTFTTDSNGYYETTLPYGKYLVKQISGKKNYSYIEDFIIDVKTSDKTQTFNLYNEEIVTNIKIVNIDSDSNLPILESGSIFKIKNLDTFEYLDDNLITNDLGNTNVITLPIGKYQIEQIDSVSGYKINENVFEFEISDEVDGNNNLEILIPNQKLKNRIEIEKLTEHYLNDKLIKIENDSNIEINIYAKEDIYSKDGLKLYSKDEVVDITTLEDDKIVSSFLEFGLYYFKNPIDNTLVEIVLDNSDNKKIKLVDQIFEYEEVADETIKENDLVIEIPNTFSQKSIFSSINILFVFIGLILIGSKKYESD